MPATGQFTGVTINKTINWLEKEEDIRWEVWIRITILTTKKQKQQQQQNQPALKNKI